MVARLLSGGLGVAFVAFAHGLAVGCGNAAPGNLAVEDALLQSGLGDEVALMQLAGTGHDHGKQPGAMVVQDEVAQARRSRSQNTTRRKCLGYHNTQSPSDYLVDNSHLQVATKGVPFRFSKDTKQRDLRTIAFWGSMISGVDEGDGWLRVGDCYLPMEVNGKPVIFRKALRDSLWNDALHSAAMKLLDFPFSQIRAVEAAGIPGGTRFTIVTGKGNSSSNSTDETHAYHVDINGTLPNVSNYADMLLGLANLSGRVGHKFHLSVRSDEVPAALAATLFRTVNGSHIFLPTGSIIPAMAAEKQIPVWEIKKAIADAVQEGIRKAEELAAKNHTQPSMAAVRKAVSDEMYGTWDRLSKTMWASRFKRREHQTTSTRPRGIAQFFQTVPVFDWCLVIVAITIFTGQHWGWMPGHCPTSRAWNGSGLIVWFTIATLYAILIFKRQGTADGILWLNGYILELIFLVENVLVSHIIIRAFRTPRWVNEKALFIVVISRIVFQLVFYMGLAELVFSGDVLPYILGLWLLYIAYQAALDDDETSFDIMDARVIHLARAAFGERLWLSKDESGALFLLKDNKRRISLVGLMVFCLVLVDVLLHVDVALTKIEELEGNGYLCFSSATVASFCLPELVFVTRDLFRRFPGLKYGISAVLIYVSAQMLLHAVFRPPVFADLFVFLGLLVCSCALPVMGLLPRSMHRRADVGTQACLPPAGDQSDVVEGLPESSATERRQGTASNDSSIGSPSCTTTGGRSFSRSTST